MELKRLGQVGVIKISYKFPIPQKKIHQTKKKRKKKKENLWRKAKIK